MKFAAFKPGAGLGLMLALVSGSALADGPRYTYPEVSEVEKLVSAEAGTLFPVGVPNTRNEAYFSGASYLAPVSDDKSVHMFNVTFGPRGHQQLARASSFLSGTDRRCRIRLLPDLGRGAQKA